MTILNVPSDAREHAKRFGAKSDQTTSAWYVLGRVSSELLNYVPRPKNKRFQEIPPRCPLCGAPTRKLINKKGDLYGVCLARFKTGCPGTVDYLKYLDGAVTTKPIRDFLPNVDSLFGPLNAPRLAEKIPHPLRSRWEEIVLEAAKVLGGEKEAVGWLFQPKAAFNHKTPVQMMGTEEGCAAVQQLLARVW